MRCDLTHRCSCVVAGSNRKRSKRGNEEDLQSSTSGNQLDLIVNIDVDTEQGNDDDDEYFSSKRVTRSTRNSGSTSAAAAAVSTSSRKPEAMPEVRILRDYVLCCMKIS